MTKNQWPRLPLRLRTWNRTPIESVQLKLLWGDYGREEENIILYNFLIYSKDSRERRFVKISVICCVGTFSRSTLWSMTFSLRKWYLIGMGFALKCIARFLDIPMELVLSHKIDIGWGKSTWMSYIFWIIHNNWVQYVVAVIYYASTIEKEIELCFLLIQETKDSPRKKSPPLVHFLSSIISPQYASV